ncbi:MAG: SPOR domain-containing protein [Thermoanaerobaculia bacterium]|nr:SPOR domain-containing protein [Thermoanaerobaculia bacterium]
MTEEKDGPVHYQVSVTGRQAAAFFLVLLAALGLSFFFGMKTGSAARRGPDPITALTAHSDIPVPTVPPADGGGRETPVPTEVPIGFDAPAPREDPRPVVRELAPPTATPAPRAATPTPRAEPGPARAESAESAQEHGPFWVQILVTSSARKADDLARKLKGEGFPPDVAPVPGKDGLFRVRIGPYADRPKAEAAAAKVTKAEKLTEKLLIVPGK